MTEQRHTFFESAELELNKVDEKTMLDLLGPLNKDRENAALMDSLTSQPLVNLRVATLAPGGTNQIAGNVESHLPREKFFDDSEAKVVQGRLWLISFTDLFSLMLCFFLMLYSMKDPAEVKAPEIKTGNVTQLYAGAGVAEAGTQQGETIQQVGYGDGLNLSYLQGVLQNALAQVHLEKDVRVVPAKNHLKLMLDTDQVFDGNVLTADGQRIAKGLASRLANLSNRITVVAVPSGSANWAGALAQASAFSELMRDAGYRKSFVVMGSGAGNNPGIEIRVEADDGNAR